MIAFTAPPKVICQRLANDFRRSCERDHRFRSPRHIQDRLDMARRVGNRVLGDWGFLDRFYRLHMAPGTRSYTSSSNLCLRESRGRRLSRMAGAEWERGPV